MYRSSHTLPTCWCREDTEVSSLVKRSPAVCSRGRGTCGSQDSTGVSIYPHSLPHTMESSYLKPSYSTIRTLVQALHRSDSRTPSASSHRHTGKSHIYPETCAGRYHPRYYSHKCHPPAPTRNLTYTRYTVQLWSTWRSRRSRTFYTRCLRDSTHRHTFRIHIHHMHPPHNSPGSCNSPPNYSCRSRSRALPVCIWRHRNIML